MEAGQIIIDLAFHLCSFNKLHEPLNYKDAFWVLAENELVPRELADRLAEWAGLRNVIAHLYDEVEESRLFEILQDDLGVFDEFIEIIENFQGI
jgi:uncharacterized protein YutE (UPF0331/DUF86 family)